MDIEEMAQEAVEDGLHDAIIRRWRDFDYSHTYSDEDGLPVQVIHRMSGIEYEIDVFVTVRRADEEPAPDQAPS